MSKIVSVLFVVVIFSQTLFVCSASINLSDEDDPSKRLITNTSVVNFDGVLNGIKDLAVAAAAGKKRNNGRSKRTPFDNNFDSPDTCSLTENELDKINNLLHSFYDKKEDQSSCEAKTTELFVVNSAGSPNRCNQLIESIIGNVKDLKIAFSCLSMQSAAAYDSRYEKQEAIYEEEKRKLQHKLDIAEKKFELSFKKEMANLNKRVQELEKYLLGTLGELEKERDRHQNTNLKLISEYLKNGNIQLACETFRNNLMGLDKNNIITIITMNTIDTDKIPIKNFIEFTLGLKNDVNAMVSCAIHIFNELEKRKGLDRETARLLQKTVDSIIQYCLDLDGTDSEESKLKLDIFTINQIILVFNKLHFINKYVHG